MNKIQTPAGNLLDYLHAKLAGKQNDAQLSFRLGVQAPVISKLRSGSLKVGATLIMRIHEEFDIPVAQIRELGGLPAYVRGA
jgi:transcriptional regulator with XRE-family HTH domain